MLLQVLDELGLGEASSLLRLEERWPEIVGEEIARHCRPTARRGQALEVSVSSSVWCQQLQLRIPEMLAALRGELGDGAPRQVWLRVETER